MWVSTIVEQQVVAISSRCTSKAKEDVVFPKLHYYDSRCSQACCPHSQVCCWHSQHSHRHSDVLPGLRNCIQATSAKCISVTGSLWECLRVVGPECQGGQIPELTGPDAVAVRWTCAHLGAPVTRLGALMTSLWAPGSVDYTPGSAGNKPGSTSNQCSAVWETQHLVWECCWSAWKS